METSPVSAEMVTSAQPLLGTMELMVRMLAECCAKELAELCDGLLLTGGPDMDPSYFGEEILNDTVCVDALRDQFEVELAKEFLARRKPILSICRGFQLLNVVMGGDLWQDVPSQLGFVHFNRDLRHPLYTEPGSVLQDLYGKEFRVNSTHHQAVRRLAPGLKATAWSKEEILEAWNSFSGDPQRLELPSAPKQFLHYFTEDNMPQTKLNRGLEGGMAVSLGRLREDSQYDYKFVCLSHNTLRGAAGGAVLLAELLCAEGYIDRK